MLKKLKRLTFVSVIIFFSINTTIITEGAAEKRMFISPHEVSIEKAVNRARKTVNMLDDMYKTFIVLITKEYVNDPTMFSAATLTKRVFKAMSKKGWHEARLLSVDDHPLNPDNSPQNDFEIDAVEAIVSGNNYYEKVEKIDNNFYLMSVTSVRAVTEGCTICHPGTKVGDLLGAISYRIYINEYLD